MSDQRQDWAELDDIRRAVYAGNPDRSPEKDVRTLLAEVDRLTEALDVVYKQLATERANVRDWKRHLRRAEADRADERRRHAELRAGVEALADEWECPAHYRAGEHGEAHIPTCHGCTKGGRLRALLSDTTTGEPT